MDVDVGKKATDGQHGAATEAVRLRAIRRRRPGQRRPGVVLQKPPIPGFRGEFTICDLVGVEDTAAYMAVLDRWALRADNRQPISESK